MYCAKKFFILGGARKQELKYANFTNLNTMSIFSSYINTLQKRYATFSGRSSRREYRSFMIVLLGTIIISMSMLVAGVFANENDTISQGIEGFLVIFCLINIIPWWALCVRRLHDLDTSGWWSLL